MNFVWASATHIGMVRDVNQDSVHPEADGRTSQRMIAAVADGMSIPEGGEIASREAMRAAVATGGKPTRRIRAANDAVLNLVYQNPRLAGIGTTLTLADLNPNGRLTIGHVGDSRAYLLRRELTQLTMDHTFVGQEIRAGRLTKEEARLHPYRAHLLRVLGMSRTVDVDVHRARLQPGDRLLICSDGLSRMLPEDEIALLLAEGPPSEAVWSLVGAANQAGGRDNVSAVVVSVNA